MSHLAFLCPIYVIDIKSAEFRIASMLNHTINLNLVTKFMVWLNMEAITKFDVKSVIKSDFKFDISIKGTKWIGL